MLVLRHGKLLLTIDYLLQFSLKLGISFTSTLGTVHLLLPELAGFFECSVGEGAEVKHSVVHHIHLLRSLMRTTLPLQTEGLDMLFGTDDIVDKVLISIVSGLHAGSKLFGRIDGLS